MRANQRGKVPEIVPEDRKYEPNDQEWRSLMPNVGRRYCIAKVDGGIVDTH